MDAQTLTPLFQINNKKLDQTSNSVKMQLLNIVDMA